MPRADINRLSGYGLALLILVVTLAVGGIILAEVETQASEQTKVTDEQYQPIDSDGITEPITITLLNTPVKEGTVSLSFYDASAAAEFALSDPENYTVINYETGELSVTYVPEYNSTDGDYLLADYTYYATTDASTILNKGKDALMNFGDWLGLIVIVIMSAVVIGITLKHFKKHRGI